MSETAKTQQHEGSYTELAVVYAALLVLLGLTIVLSFVGLGSTLALVVALGISAAKTGLIMWYFMHLKYRVSLVWLFAVAGMVWLLVLFGLTLSDYVTRWWVLFEG
jgi:cytochrome c oxidase subunit 4